MNDGICCIYRGGTQAKEDMEKAGQGGNEVDHLIACYKDLKSRNGYANPYEMMQLWCGDYNYILYDCFVGDEGGVLVVNVREHGSFFFFQKLKVELILIL